MSEREKPIPRNVRLAGSHGPVVRQRNSFFTSMDSYNKYRIVFLSHYL